MRDNVMFNFVVGFVMFGGDGIDFVNEDDGW